jgi:hypothetical protein
MALLPTDATNVVCGLSKVPKEGYTERLQNCPNWKVGAIKMCDRLDNLRSLMIPGNTLEFQKKQIKETKEKYFPIFDKTADTLCPPEYAHHVRAVRDEIKRLVERYSTIIELQQNATTNC